jgi:hypothetical protein
MSNTEYNEFDQSEIMEVLVPCEKDEFFYRIETNDEDLAIKLALAEHTKLNRPNVINDENQMIHPLAYSPPIDANNHVAMLVQNDKNI